MGLQNYNMVINTELQLTNSHMLFRLSSEIFSRAGIYSSHYKTQNGMGRLMAIAWVQNVA
jgi:hypothetical protein